MIVPMERAHRIARMRDYDVDRQGIVHRAIIKATESGYIFNEPLPNKDKDDERQRRARYDMERPLAEWKALWDENKWNRLHERLLAAGAKI